MSMTGHGKLGHNRPPRESPEINLSPSDQAECDRLTNSLINAARCVQSMERIKDDAKVEKLSAWCAIGQAALGLGDLYRKARSGPFDNYSDTKRNKWVMSRVKEDASISALLKGVNNLAQARTLAKFGLQLAIDLGFYGHTVVEQKILEFELDFARALSLRVMAEFPEVAAYSVSDDKFELVAGKLLEIRRTDYLSKKKIRDARQRGGMRISRKDENEYFNSIRAFKILDWTRNDHDRWKDKVINLARRLHATEKAKARHKTTQQEKHNAQLPLKEEAADKVASVLHEYGLDNSTIRDVRQRVLNGTLAP